MSKANTSRNSLTPQKNRTPKSKQKEKWIDNEDGSFVLSTDENIQINSNLQLVGLRVSTEKHDNINLRLLSGDLHDDIFFISPTTMELMELKIGDLCHITLNDVSYTAVIWPKPQMRFSTIILSAHMIKEIKSTIDSEPTRIQLERIQSRLVITLDKHPIQSSTSGSFYLYGHIFTLLNNYKIYHKNSHGNRICDIRLR